MTNQNICFRIEVQREKPIQKRGQVRMYCVYEILQQYRIYFNFSAGAKFYEIC